MNNIRWLLFFAAMLSFISLWGDTEKIMTRRSDFARCVEEPAQRTETIVTGLKDVDPEIRSAALFHAVDVYTPEEWEQHCLALSGDPDTAVRQRWLICSAMLTPPTNAITAAWNRLSREDPAPEIRKLAAQLNWPFFRNNVLLSKNPHWDHAVNEIDTIALPKESWRFQTDPEGVLHLSGVWQADYDDSGWPTIGIGPWEQQGFPDYNGYAWYRLKFLLPVRPDINALEIAFDGVDEEAWVGLNGVYLGAHAIGPDGWNVPFRLDATAEARWNAANILVVRVHDSALAGGIWQPVRLGLMK